MICYVCDKESFYSFEKLNPARELLCCKNCGSVFYKVDSNQESKMLDYYKKEYRPQPNHMNLLTTTRKQNYLDIFLKDFLKDKKGLVTCDVGCATGYIPNYLRTLGHKATGCEYTLTFRRFSEHFYGIPLTEEIRTDLRYDLITIYHVLEHMIEPDKKLKLYASLLKDDGRIMVATPRWYRDLEESSGPNISTFVNLWHKDHINVFSEQSLKNLFIKCGLEIEKEDHYVYGQSYMLKKYTGTAEREIVKENPEERIKQTYDAEKAIEAYRNKEYRKAIKLWEKFPDAWLGLIFGEAGKDPIKQADLFKESEQYLKSNHRMDSAKCMWLYQNQNYKEAIELMERIIKIKPDEEKFMYLGYANSLLGDHKNAMVWFSRAADMNPQKWTEAFDWICKEASTMQTWDERAIESIRDQVGESAKKGLKLVDPMFDKPSNSNVNSEVKDNGLVNTAAPAEPSKTEV